MIADSRPGRSSGDPSEAAVRALLAARRQGHAPDIYRLWRRHDSAQSIDVLAALVKADLQWRFRHGERPEVAEYLDRFPDLRVSRERVVSLAYEEFHLREKEGEVPDPEAFCHRYAPWRDSLAFQLQIHRSLSRIVDVATVETKFPSPGDRFSTFHLRSILGQGGSARVFLALDEVLGNREVALKLSADRSDEPTIQGRLDHSHIVPVLSVYDDAATGLRGLSMPYRAGLPLDRVIGRVDPASRPKHAIVLRRAICPGGKTEDTDAPLEDLAGWSGFPSKGTYAEGVAWVVSVIAKALAYAHGKGVLHRDVKPANVLLTFRDGPQLLDFNLAHSTLSAKHAEEALRGGTLPYMAPEHLEAFCDPERWEDVGEAADIYAVGLLLREMLTGEKPDSPRQDQPLSWIIRDLLDRRARGFAPVRKANPEIPHALDAIVTRCLAPHPGDRYPSAAVLAEDLRRFVDHRPLHHAANPSRSERMGNWVRRVRPTLVALATAAALLGLLGLAFIKAAPMPTAHGPASVATKLSPLTHVLIGHEHRKNGQFDAARTEFEAALKIDPRFFKAHWGLAVLEHDLGRKAASLERLQTAADYIDRERVDPPQKSSFYHDFAVALSKRERWAEAGQMYQKAIDVYSHPSNHASYAGLSVVASKQDDFPRARSAIEGAIEQASGPGSEAGPLRIDGYRLWRAQVLMNLAIRLQHDGEQNFRACRELSRKGLDDLDQARRSEAKFEPADRGQMQMAQAGLLMVLGDIASYADDYRKSLPLYEQADSALQSPFASRGDRAKVQVMKAKIAERLQGDRAALRRHVTVPHLSQ